MKELILVSCIYVVAHLAVSGIVFELSLNW